MGECVILEVPSTLAEVLELCRFHRVAEITLAPGDVIIKFEPTIAPEEKSQPQIEIDPLFWSAQ